VLSPILRSEQSYVNRQPNIANLQFQATLALPAPGDEYNKNHSVSLATGFAGELSPTQYVFSHLIQFICVCVYSEDMNARSYNELMDTYALH
jgi:hypothetical protein